MELIASRMRLTPIDVMDQERGTALYTMDELRDRLRWHLDSKNMIASVLLAEADASQIVEPASLRRGVAHHNARLIDLFRKHGFEITRREGDAILNQEDQLSINRAPPTPSNFGTVFDYTIYSIVHIFSMWSVFESKKAARNIDRLTKDVLEKYKLWKSVAHASGAEGLRKFPGFRDHALKGERIGHRSSYLNDSYRVIYWIDGNAIRINVMDVNHHDYKNR